MLTSALHQAGVYALSQDLREQFLSSQDDGPARAALLEGIKGEQERRGVPVGFISAESSSRSIVRRMLVNLAQANGMHVQTGHISHEEKARLLSATVPLAAGRLCVESPEAVTPAGLRLLIRRMVLQHQIRILFFDHLGELTDPDLRGDQIRYVFKAGAEALRWAAREFGLTVVAAIHIKRESETELRSKSRRPVKTDLAESAFVERCADGIGILYRDRSGEGDDHYDVANDGGDVWPVNLRVCKQREGPTGDARFRFHRPQFRYEDAYLGAGGVDRGERRREERRNEARGAQEGFRII
jgi:replicative DNA helicase